MKKDHGNRMAGLHLHFLSGQEPYLNDTEIVELRDWLKELYQYNYHMGHGINAVYFGSEYEEFNKICLERNRKKFAYDDSIVDFDH